MMQVRTPMGPRATGGVMVQVQVPDGCCPGQTFRVQPGPTGSWIGVLLQKPAAGAHQSDMNRAGSAPGYQPPLLEAL